MEIVRIEIQSVVKDCDVETDVGHLEFLPSSGKRHHVGSSLLCHLSLVERIRIAVVNVDYRDIVIFADIALGVTHLSP